MTELTLHLFLLYGQLLPCALSKPSKNCMGVKESIVFKSKGDVGAAKHNKACLNQTDTIEMKLALLEFRVSMLYDTDLSIDLFSFSHI